MEGKRTQGVMHKYLLEAADGIQTKGISLSERLYVPEQFHEDRKTGIAERRRCKLALLQSPEDDVQVKMALVIGEYKGEDASPFGRKVWLKHMPDAPLFIDARAWERIERAYGSMLEARDADTKTKPRVVMCALIYAKREHIYQIDTASFMLTTTARRRLSTCLRLANRTWQLTCTSIPRDRCDNHLLAFAARNARPGGPAACTK
jgi:Protein of unknown function (DUF1173)